MRFGKQTLIQRIALRKPVGNEEVKVAVTVKVAHGQSHASFVFRCERLRALIGEAPVLLVDEEAVHAHIVADVKLGPAIQIEIGGRHREAAAIGVRDCGVVRNVGERTIAIVVQ